MTHTTWVWGWMALLPGVVAAQSEPGAETKITVQATGEPAQAPEPVQTPEAQTPEPAQTERGRLPEGIDPVRLRNHLIDPQVVAEFTKEELCDLAKPEAKHFDRVLEMVAQVKRPRQITLTLEDALERMLKYNFALEVARYNPAIEATRVVEAEAVFDASLFSSLSKVIQDRPSGSQLAATDFDRFYWNTGVRKVLPTGMQVSTSYSLERQFTSLAFQQLNPQYFSQLNLGLQQPLLRGFGIDFNRSAIVVAVNNKRIADYQFQQRIRESLRQTEVAFWQLVQARREVVISARLLQRFESIYDNLWARREFDVNKIQLEDTNANLATSRADFLRVLSNVRNAEDQLLSLMNDPELSLADDLEILPEGLPVFPRILVDRVGELQTALENRSEIREGELLVSNALSGIGQARNGTLPRLDLTFNYAVDGLGKSADRSFDEVTKNDFNEYTIGIEFEVPIGNRAAKSRLIRARLSLAQAEAELKRRTEEVITQVSVGVRNLDTNWNVLLPRLESVEAGVRQVQAIDARAEKKDYAQLNAELGALNGLAVGRRQLLQALIDYHIAVIDLEAAKGTLLQYNNVIIAPLKEN